MQAYRFKVAVALPLVSVLVPTYNPKHWLLETICSIRKQSYKRIEIVLADDASTSGVDLLNTAIKSFEIDCVIRFEVNSGTCAKPLNHALRSCNGDFVCVCAQDDFFSDVHKIQRQVSLMLSDDRLGMVYTDADVLEEPSGRLVHPRTPKRRGGEIFEDLILQRFYIPAPTVMIRREVFDAVGFYDERLYIEDWDMHLRIATKFLVGYLPKVTTVVRSHDASMSHSRTFDMAASRRAIITKWAALSINWAALRVSLFLDFRGKKGDLPSLFANLLISLLVIRQPIRLTRILSRHLIIIYDDLFKKKS